MQKINKEPNKPQLAMLEAIKKLENEGKKEVLKQWGKDKPEADPRAEKKKNPTLEEFVKFQREKYVKAHTVKMPVKIKLTGAIRKEIKAKDVVKVTMRPVAGKRDMELVLLKKDAKGTKLVAKKTIVLPVKAVDEGSLKKDEGLSFSIDRSSKGPILKMPKVLIPHSLSEVKDKTQSPVGNKVRLTRELRKLKIKKEVK
jgi:hypothetical protein